MDANKKSVELSGLYAITDGALQDDLIPKCKAVLSADPGISLLQYRDKSADLARRLTEASALLSICRQYHTQLIINDDIALAEQVGAAGVHLGKLDDSVQAARARLGDAAIIGVSCYNELERALAAEQAGADYVAFGSFFASPTKPDAPVASLELLYEAKARLRIPVCCIGGITQENAPRLIAAGADMVAVISSVFGASDIAQAVQGFNDLFQVQPC